MSGTYRWARRDADRSHITLTAPGAPVLAPSQFADGKVGNHAEMVRQVAVLVDVADDAQRCGSLVPAQRDVVYGSLSLEAQACRGN